MRLVPGPLPAPIGGGRSTTDTYHQVVLDATHVFSPTWIANAQFAFSRALAAQFGLSKGFNFADLGFPANLNALAVDQFIEGSIADIGGISNVSDSFVQYQPRNTWTSRASVAHSRGSHNLKAGVDWRVLNFNEGQNTQPNGNYSFGRTFTQGPNPVQASRNGGFGFADFLLGMPNSGRHPAIDADLDPGTVLRSIRPGRLARERPADAESRPALGPRRGRPREVQPHRLLRPERAQSARPEGRAAEPDRASALGRRRERQATSRKRSGTISVRASASRSRSPRTASFAAATAFSLFPRNIQGNGDGAIEAFRDTPMVASIDGGLTNANRLSNPFPQGVLPPLNDRDPLANVGAAIQAPVYPYKSGYVQLSSLNYQWEMPGGIVMQAGYWGNKGTHLISGAWNINQLPDQYLSLGNQLNNQVRNPVPGSDRRRRALRTDHLTAPIVAAVSAVLGRQRRAAGLRSRRELDLPCRHAHGREALFGKPDVPDVLHLVEGHRRCRRHDRCLQPASQQGAVGIRHAATSSSGAGCTGCRSARAG